MTQDTPAFYTLDRGTVGTSAALIAPVDGRYRMLGAASAPAAIDPEPILEDLAWRVARTDASVAGSMEGWRKWSRLEVATVRPARAVLVAASAKTGEFTERAFVGAGWAIAARFFELEPDVVTLGDACLDPAVDAVIVGGREDVEEAERDAAYRLWHRVGSLARFRDDLAVVACGPFAERPEGIADARLFSLPAPDPVPLTADSMLRGAAQQVGVHIVDEGRPGAADGRAALRTTVASLAGLLGVRIDGLEVGVAAGSRTVARPDGAVRHAVMAAAGLLPPELFRSEEVAEGILRWSTLGGDPAVQLDGLRELAQHPWSRIDRDGAHFRLAALRAALERLEATWAGASSEASADEAEMVILSGGVFGALPPAASALAVVDGVRRPGALAILHDHAGILAPLGALPVEEDRRRLLADLTDDCLLPLGSAIVTGSLGRPDRTRGVVTVSSMLGDERLPLEPGQLRRLDLPPGISARVGVEPSGGPVLGVTEGRLELEVRGGLGGLLLDTRDIPLELPAGGEARRTAIDAWEAPAWAGSER